MRCWRDTRFFPAKRPSVSSVTTTRTSLPSFYPTISMATAKPSGLSQRRRVRAVSLPFRADRDTREPASRGQIGQLGIGSRPASQDGQGAGSRLGQLSHLLLDLAE